MRNFDYIKVRTVQEAVNLLVRHGEKAQILAGGTDVLVKLKEKQISPEILVDIKGIPDLQGVEYQPGQGMRIGTLTVIREIELSPVVKECLPALADAAHLLGSVQIRNRATIGGNLCNALPSADMGPFLIGMGSKVTVMGPAGERRLLIEDLFAGSGQNSLGPGEVAVAIEIPPWSKHTGGAYIKHAIKNAVDVAIVCVSGVVVTDPLQRCFEDVKVVLGAVGPRPIRAKNAEMFLKGKPIEEEVINKAGDLASKEATPRTTVEYKTEMVKVLTRRALREALKRVPGEG
jgi:CO/xanthine dehydrogenase FAD-binding subunit